MATGRRSRPKSGTYVRVIISVALLAYVFLGVEWSSLGQVIRQTDPIFLTLSFLIGFIVIGVSTLKWWLLLRAVGVRVSFIQLFVLYKAGSFFSNVLPTNVGGDVIRAAALGRSTSRYSVSASSVFVERFTGLVALVLMASVSVPFNHAVGLDPRVLAGVIFAFGSCVAIFVLVVSPGTLTWFERLPLHPVLRRLLNKAQALQNAIVAYRDYPGVLVACLLLSFLWNVVAVANVYLTTLAFGYHLPFATLLVTVPLVLAVLMFPISFGGIGLSEWSYTFVFTQLGMTPAVGLSVALLLRLKSVLLGVAGVGLYSLGIKSMATNSDLTAIAGSEIEPAPPRAALSEQTD